MVKEPIFKGNDHYAGDTLILQFITKADFLISAIPVRFAANTVWSKHLRSDPEHAGARIL